MLWSAGSSFTGASDSAAATKLFDRKPNLAIPTLDKGAYLYLRSINEPSLHGCSIIGKALGLIMSGLLLRLVSVDRELRSNHQARALIHRPRGVGDRDWDRDRDPCGVDGAEFALHRLHNADVGLVSPALRPLLMPHHGKPHFLLVINWWISCCLNFFCFFQT